MSGAVDRSELEALDRDVLIERAAGQGVSDARVLTRAELVDELILRGPDEPEDKQRARGFFGLARDLLAHAVQRGLHLPDAAERILTSGTLPPSARMRAPAALPTVTLAGIYAAQGHIARAIDTIQSVLVREPDHEAARAFLARLTDVSYSHVRPSAPGGAGDDRSVTAAGDRGDRSAEDGHALAASGAQYALGPPDLHLEGPSSEVDECIAVPGDSGSLFVYWALRFRTIEYVVGRCPGGATVLRLVVVTPRIEGPTTEVRDRTIASFVGDTIIRDLPPGAIVRVAVGWKSSAGEFCPAAHSPALEAESVDRSMWGIETICRSTPAGLKPIDRADKDAPAIVRALERARRETVCCRRGSLEATPPDVATVERWIYAPAAWSVATE
jgi:hypothetical protein